MWNKIFAQYIKILAINICYQQTVRLIIEINKLFTVGTVSLLQHGRLHTQHVTITDGCHTRKLPAYIKYVYNRKFIIE